MHVWTYAAGGSDNAAYSGLATSCGCPCTGHGKSSLPAFLGNTSDLSAAYYCDTAWHGATSAAGWHTSDVLWNLSGALAVAGGGFQQCLDDQLAYVCASTSVSPSVTPTISVTATRSETSTVTASSSATPTVTPTSSVTPTFTPTATATESRTATVSLTVTVTSTPSATVTATTTASATVTVTPTASVTRSTSATRTPSGTSTPSRSETATISPSSSFVSFTSSVSITPSNTPTTSFTASETQSASWTPSVSITPSLSLTQTPVMTNGRTCDIACQDNLCTAPFNPAACLGSCSTGYLTLQNGGCAVAHSLSLVLAVSSSTACATQTSSAADDTNRVVQFVASITRLSPAQVTVTARKCTDNSLPNARLLLLATGGSRVVFNMQLSALDSATVQQAEAVLSRVPNTTTIALSNGNLVVQGIVLGAVSSRCDVSCRTCTNTLATNCTSCHSGYALQQRACVQVDAASPRRGLTHSAVVAIAVMVPLAVVLAAALACYVKRARATGKPATLFKTQAVASTPASQRKLAASDAVVPQQGDARDADHGLTSFGHVQHGNLTIPSTNWRQPYHSARYTSPPRTAAHQDAQPPEVLDYDREAAALKTSLTHPKKVKAPRSTMSGMDSVRGGPLPPNSRFVPEGDDNDIGSGLQGRRTPPADVQSLHEDDAASPPPLASVPTETRQQPDALPTRRRRRVRRVKRSSSTDGESSMSGSRPPSAQPDVQQLVAVQVLHPGVATHAMPPPPLPLPQHPLQPQEMYAGFPGAPVLLQPDQVPVGMQPAVVYYPAESTPTPTPTPQLQLLAQQPAGGYIPTITPPPQLSVTAASPAMSGLAAMEYTGPQAYTTAPVPVQEATRRARTKSRQPRRPPARKGHAASSVPAAAHPSRQLLPTEVIDAALHRSVDWKAAGSSPRTPAHKSPQTRHAAVLDTDSFIDEV